MAERVDKLGRRIPVFDRSAAGRKGAKVKKEKYGSDFYKRAGAMGGRNRGRGYFGKLKDEGRETELKALSAQARKAKKTKDSVNRVNESGSHPPVSGRR